MKALGVIIFVGYTFLFHRGLYAQVGMKNTFADSTYIAPDSSALNLEAIRYFLLRNENNGQHFNGVNNFVIPEHKLGLFCIFEDKLRRKTKLPLDFGTD